MLTLSQLPPRNKGTYLDKCQKIKLTTNLFKVDFKANTTITIFAVSTVPTIAADNGKKLRALLIINRANIQKLIGHYVISGRTIYGARLQGNGTMQEQLNIRVQFESCIYKIYLKKVKVVNISDIYSEEKNKSGIVFSFLNSMMRNFFHQQDYTQIGKSRKYFDPKNRMEIQNANITIFKGYSSSFSLLENGLHLKIDPAMKIIRSQTVLDIVNKVYAINSFRSKSQKRMLVQEQLLGKTVMANYGKNRYYIIQSVQFQFNAETYEFNDGQKRVNLLDYYQKTYDIELKSKKQPLVKAVSNRKKDDKSQIILIPELLLMSGLPDDFDQRKRMEISQATIVNPNDKYADIENIFRVFNSDSSSTFSPKTIEENLGIKIQSKPATITAKQLSYPVIQLGGKESIEQNKACNFMLFNKALFSHNIDLKVTVFLPNDFDFNAIKSLFISTCTNLGLTQKLSIEEMNFKDFKNVFKNIQSVVNRESGNGNSNIFWFIIPSSFKTQYKNIKRLCLKAGVEKVSQVSVTNTLQKKGMASILTKILLQMAAKVGNRLWVPKVSQKLQNSGVLLIGTELTKDSENKGTNIISFCSNINKDFSSFYSNYIYENKKEERQNTKIIIYQCLNEYVVKNGSAPAEVILMKNGSTKIDQRIHLQAEINQIKEILKAGQKEYGSIYFTYLIVDKDTSLKLFNERGTNICNPNSGTLVNAQAIGKGQEFYLVAQQSNRGTIKPTFYKTIYTDTKLQEGLFQELIYSQCFNYMNWSGSIKIPSVMQYAKKLGAFIGQHINKENSFNKMNKNLYFI